MPIDFEYILLLIVVFFPIYYKFSFWLYVIQLKEYRLDRFKEYFGTKQWKRAYFNFWFLLEFPILFSTFFIFFDKNLEIIIFPTVFYFFVIQNIFVFWKFFRHKIKKPKKTLRLLLTFSIILLFLSVDLYYVIFWWFENFIFLLITILTLLTPLYIFAAIFISLPLVNYLKKKKINKAIKKSLEINKLIKIWITWSYWKSSVKEYLSTILEQDAKVLKTPENINTELWVSDIILNKLKNKYNYFIAEMWAYKIWEIKQLWEIVNHKYWFLTAIWNQHIWLFWNKKNIIKAKLEIKEQIIKNKWTLYVNFDNKEISKIKFPKKINLVKYWSTEWCDAKWIFKNIKWSNFVFNFTYKDIDKNFETNLIWEHNIINLTWIIAFCIDMWINIKNIKKYILELKTPKNTLKISDKKYGKHKLKIINDTYNLSEDWLYAGIKILKYFNDDFEKILVIDDILELWKESKTIHYSIWKKIAEDNLVNKIVYVWINYKTSFIKWLIDWKFDKNNILNNITSIDKDSIFLLEWRNAKKFKIIKK